jgi:hypothetical protein
MSRRQPVPAEPRPPGSIAELEARLRKKLTGVEEAGRRLSVALWLDLVGLMVMTAAGVTVFAIAHGVPAQVAWMADPLLGATLVIVLQGDAVLARHRIGGEVITPSGSALYVRILAGGGTWAMNTWQSWQNSDWAGVVLHSIFPALLIGLSEAVSYYRRKFGQIAGEIRAELDRLDGAARAEAAAAVDAEQAARLAAVEAQAEQARQAVELERARVEAEREAAAARAEAARTEQARLAAEVERVRVEQQAEVQRLQAEAEAHAAAARLAEIEAAEARRQDQAATREQRRQDRQQDRAAGAGTGSGTGGQPRSGTGAVGRSGTAAPAGASAAGTSGGAGGEASRLDWDTLLRRARELDAQQVAETGKPASRRVLQAALGIGTERAIKVREALDTAAADSTTGTAGAGGTDPAGTAATAAGGPGAGTDPADPTGTGRSGQAGTGGAGAGTAAGTGAAPVAAGGWS